MNSKRVFLTLAVVLMIAMQAALAGAQNGKGDGPSGHKLNLEGTWLADVTFTDGFTLKVLFTFIPNKYGEEGTLIDTNEYQFTPNPICTPDQGVWVRTGDRDFAATHKTFCFDQNEGGNPAGTAKIRDTIRLSRSGNEFTGRQRVDVYDTGGNLVDTFDATMQAVRMRVEPL